MNKDKAHKQAIKQLGDIPCLTCKVAYLCNGLRMDCIKAQNYLELYNGFMKQKIHRTPKLIDFIRRILKIKRPYFIPIKEPYKFLINNGYDTI